MNFAPVPFAGGAYADETRPWSQQDTVNYLPVRAERPGTRSEWKLVRVPGRRPFAIVGSGPIRGMHNAEGKRFVVSGNALLRVNVDGTAEEIGEIPGVGRVSMAHNQRTGGNQLLVTNGDSGFVHDTSDGSFGRITDDGYPGATTVRFLGQYLVQIEPLRRFFFHSNLADARDYNTLDRYEAESAPDLLMTLEVSQGQLLVFGERTTEVWENRVSGRTAFQRTGIVIERGAASPHATAVIDNSVNFLGDDGVFWRLDGYTPVRISTHPLEQAWGQLDLSGAFCFTWEDHGHKVVYLTFATGQTWGFDIATREWHRRQTYGLDRWGVNALVRWGRDWYAGDYASGRIAKLDWTTGMEWGVPMERIRTFAVMHAEGNPIKIPAVRIELDTGLAEAEETAGSEPVSTFPALSIAGNFPDVGWQGDDEDYSYTVSGGVAPYVIDVSAGALPGGIAQDGSTVRIHGKRTMVGPFNWTMRVTDADGRTATVADTTTTKNAQIYFWRQETVGIATSESFSSHVSGDVIAIGHGGNVVSYSTNRGVNWATAAAHSSGSMAVLGLVKYLGDWYGFGQFGGTAKAVKATGDTFVFADLAIPFAIEGSTSYQIASVIGDYLYVGVKSGTAGTPNYTLRRFDGSDWVEYNTGISAPVNATFTNGVEINGYYLFGTNTGVVVRTQDFVTWGVALDTLNGANRTFVAKLDNRLIVSGYGIDTFYLSDDFGATFTSYAYDKLVSANGKHFISTATAFVRTSDTGASGSWTLRFTAPSTPTATTIHTDKDLSVVGTFASGVYVGDVA